MFPFFFARIKWRRGLSARTPTVAAVPSVAIKLLKRIERCQHRILRVMLATNRTVRGVETGSQGAVGFLTAHTGLADGRGDCQKRLMADALLIFGFAPERTLSAPCESFTP